MFSITARQPVTLQQQEAARKAIERAKSCLKLPKTHIDTDKRAFYPAKQTYSEWLKSWEIWVTPLHINQRRIALLDAHESVPRVKSALHATTLTPEYAEAKEANEWQTMYDLLLAAVKSTQNTKIWTEKLKARFKTESVTRGTALVTFFDNKVILCDQIKENDEHFDTSPSEIYQTTLRTSKGVKDATYLDTLRNTLDALPLDYETEIERDAHIQTIRRVIERISTRRNRRGESSDTEETSVNEISDGRKTADICDYCDNSRNPERKANASKCPGRFGKTYENGKVRNPNCRVLISNRLKRELKRKRKNSDGDSENPKRQKGNGREKNTMKCHRCGKPGHLARDCRQPDTRTCYKCGQTGHIAKDCPNGNTRAPTPPKPRTWPNPRNVSNVPAWQQQQQQQQQQQGEQNTSWANDNSWANANNSQR